MTKNKIDMEELKVKVVEVSQEKEQPQGNDFIRVIVEIDGRKIAVWTTESNINALCFDIDRGYLHISPKYITLIIY